MAGPKNGNTDKCYVCLQTDGEQIKWLGCSTCDTWAHIKCVHLTGVKYENVQRINWVCDECLHSLKIARKWMDKIDEMKDMINDGFRAVKQDLRSQVDEVKKGVEGVTEVVGDVSEAMKVDATAQASPSYAEVIQQRKKRVEKNLLIVRASEENEKAIDKKDKVSQALSGVQIQDARFTSGGNIVMNFENEATRDEAAQKLENLEKVTVKSVRKIMPKIMICNVPQEESKDTMIEFLIDRNEYLQTIPDIENKIKIIFSKPSAGGTMHYILKCDPSVRKLIHKNHDKLKLEWGVYMVRDRYHAIVCYYCQRYGHLEDNCTAKRNGEDPCCHKCAGHHRSKDCNVTEKRCINCVRFKKPTIDHSVNEKCCPIFIGELERIRTNTDHGY